MRDELRPDILYSYNGDCFDAPYFELRAQEHTRPAGLAGRGASRSGVGRSFQPAAVYAQDLHARGGSEDAQKIESGAFAMRAKRFDSPGVAHHDVLQFARRFAWWSSLSAVSAHVLGGTAGKYDLPIQTMLTTLAGNDVRAWAEVAVYNLRDAVSTMQIMLSLKQVQFSLQLAAVTNCAAGHCAGGWQKRPQWWGARHAPAASSSTRRPSSTLNPCRGSVAAGKGQGASVLDVKAGWYRDPVVTCDYSSLYPSLLISHNLCPSRVLLREVKSDLSPSVPAAVRAAVKSYEDEEMDDDVRWTYHVVQRGADGAQEGVLPVVASRLLAERKEAKTEMKAHAPGSVAYEFFDAKQNAWRCCATRSTGC